MQLLEDQTIPILSAFGSLYQNGPWPRPLQLPRRSLKRESLSFPSPYPQTPVVVFSSGPFKAISMATTILRSENSVAWGRTTYQATHTRTSTLICIHYPPPHPTPSPASSPQCDRTGSETGAVMAAGPAGCLSVLVTFCPQ